MAITFDDLPVHGPLPPGETRLQVAQTLLAAIAAAHLPPVTGFVNAVRLADAPTGSAGVLEAWRDAGQPLASHTYTHMGLDSHSAEAFEADVTQNEATLTRLAAYPAGHPQLQDWRYLRYPFLQEGDTPEKRAAVRSWLTGHGYQIAEVSITFPDYLWNEPYARCVAARNGRGVTWLHDTYLAAARDSFAAQRAQTRAVFGHEIAYILLLHIGAFDARMFPELVAQMRQANFLFISLPDAAADPAYSVPAAEMKGGGTFEDQVGRAKGINGTPTHDYTAELAAMCR